MVGGGAEARIANERPAGVWQNTEETEEQEVAHTDAEPPPSPLTLMTDQSQSPKSKFFKIFLNWIQYLYFDQMAALRGAQNRCSPRSRCSLRSPA
jgi:hypothetical protein